MHRTITTILAVTAITSVASAGLSVHTVNFDSLPLGPDTYAAAGPAQTLNFISNQVTFSGGVILGFPTAFPAVEFATAPNVYASSNFADPSLSNILSIDISGLDVNLVEGLLFNGEIHFNDFEVRAYDIAGLLLDSEIYTIDSNANSGAAIFSMSSAIPNIARIEFEEFNSDGQWNMLLDTITFNQVIPAPSSLLSLAGLGLIASRRRRA
ncbi:MAG: hypothetical protein JKY43_09190 [Phycisphaerales bacterium]|nr:hypothetical protein [Phycisphaerales bacterium]